MDFQAYYDAHWLGLGPYFELHRTRFVQSWKALQDAIPLRAPQQVLDVGGVGPLAAFLAAEHGWQAHESKTDLRNALPFADATFGLVLCTETIEHIKDLDSERISDLEAFNYSGIHNLLSELRRLMLPGGRLLITTPNSASWLALDKWLWGEVLLMDPQHVREFTTADLQRTATRCGLATVRIETIDSWAPNLDLRAKRLRDRIGVELAGDARLAGIGRGDNIVAVFKRADGA